MTAPALPDTLGAEHSDTCNTGLSCVCWIGRGTLTGAPPAPAPRRYLLDVLEIVQAPGLYAPRLTCESCENKAASRIVHVVGTDDVYLVCATCAPW